MQPRHKFQEEMRTLVQSIERMSVMVEESIRKAFHALEVGDSKLADQVIAQDERIDQLQRDVEYQCTTIIATEQPVAGDLREVITAVKIVSNIERIGDHGRHLAHAVTTVSKEHMAFARDDLKQMADIAVQMLEQAITGFASRDADAARRAAARDNEIDALHSELQKKLTSKMKEDPNFVEDGSVLLFLNRFMERFGDHVTNICEWVSFADTAEYVELNK
jgi:phosphate transport system protein